MKKNKLALFILTVVFLGGCYISPSYETNQSIISDTADFSESTFDPEPPKPEIYEYETVPYEYKSVVDYYAPVVGLSGWRLKNALYEIIRGHTKVGYDGPSGMTYQTFYAEIDVDVNDSNNINLLYSGSAHKFTPFDREHIWPKSLGLGGTEYKKFLSGIDIYNLRPALSTINSTRGNKEWDKGDTVTNDNLLGNKYGNNFFEPIDEYKGDIARAIFYMATRYEGYEMIDGELSQTPDLELVNSVGNTFSSDSKVAYLGNVITLLEWNKLDPVDESEVYRNEIIYTKYQHNRNPFVDHPEYAEMIFDSEYSGDAASNLNPESAKENLPQSLNSGIGSCVEGTVKTEVFLKDASGVGTSYASNINKTFTVGSTSLTMSAGLKSGYNFTLGTNSIDVIPANFIKTGTTVKNNASTLLINDPLLNIDGFKVRYANPILNSITSYHLFSSTDGGNTYYEVASWQGYDSSLQKGCVFTSVPSALYAFVISGTVPRISVVSLTFYQNSSLK